MDVKRYLAVLVCLLLVGCSPPTIYQLAVSPADDGAMRRELTVTNGGGLEEMLGTIYDRAVEDGEGLRYSGSFDAIPQDVGGSGTWLRVTSPMGSVYLYAERFRGDDDLVGQIEARLRATDRMADLLITWFESELSDDPRWPVLREFMDTQLRHDMKNLSLYILLERQGQAADQWGPIYLARAGQYLADRGYFGDSDLRALMSLLNSGNPQSAGESASGLLQRMAARRMGLQDGAQVPESLSFLRIPDGIETSWQAFMSSPACAELVGAWGVQKLDESLEADDIEGAVSAVFSAGIGMEFELFSSPDEVRLTLDCGTQPLATNGEWDDEAQRVTWSGHVRERSGLPLFFYACWAEPDTDYQEAHFGGVVFSGESLVKLATWYAGLSIESRQRWDGFIGSLDSSKSIRGQVESSFTAGMQEGPDPLVWGYWHLISALPAEPQ